MRFYLKLNESETRAISALAVKEYRDIPSQVILIIHQDLQRRGLLPQEDPKQPAVKLCAEVRQS